ncbi:MAG: LPS export ABC transporter permease LptG [Oligoflexia bacterium]|nr:LPS export ABC transporter permease LptG [Oligoflexia bacterium]
MFLIVDRYIVKEFLKYFVATLIVFVTLYTAVDMLTTIWQLKADSATLWKFYLYQLPNTISRLIPVACLMGTIFTISMMSRSNELTSLFSAGMSLARITLPILIITVFISVTSFFISNKLVPIFNKKKNYIEFVEIRKQPWRYYTIKTSRIWYRNRDLIYNIRNFNPKGNSVAGLTIYYFSPDWKLMQLTSAQSGILDGQNWKLENGSVTIFDSQHSFPITEHFSKKTITMDEPPIDLQSLEDDKDIMTAADLRNFISKNKELGLDTNRYEMAYHSKFSYAFISFVMAFLGIPFSVTRERSGGFALNVGICFGVVFIYWTLISVFTSLGSSGTLPAFFAAWLPNALMLAVAVKLLMRLKK